MRRLLCFTLITASVGMAFEKPGESTPRQVKSMPEIDYSKVKPIEQSEATPDIKAPAAESMVSPATTESTAEPMNKLPWLGVLGDPISEAMKAQLGLEHGLVLKYVVPNSPAEKAGLGMYDIIYSLDGHPVSNQMQLKKLICSQKVADCVKLKVHSKGQSGLLEVKLCEKPVKERVSINPKESKTHEFSELRRLMNEGIQKVEPNEETRERRGVGRMFGRILKEFAPNLDLNFETTSSVIIQDAEGSVEIQTINNSKNVIVKDSQNRVEFEGAWNTEEDFTQAPPHIKDRIDNINYRGLNKGVSKIDIR